jgi:Ca-activated chloride channel family protein
MAPQQMMQGMMGRAQGGMPKVAEIARAAKGSGTDGLALNRGRVEEQRLSQLGAGAARPAPTSASSESALYSFRALQEAGEKKRVYDEARRELSQRNLDKVQAGKLGVDLSIDANALRNQVRLTQTAVRQVNGRTCLELGGIWIDEGFEAKTPALEVKAMSAAYFRILERHPEMKEVFRLGNHLVWVAPSGTALVIDTGSGKETLSDADIDGLFASKK